MAVRYVQSCRLPTPFGVFDMHGFEEPDTGKEHIALTLGSLASDEPMLARTHSECLTGDALYSMRCDCGYQLEEALRSIAREGRGILLYLRQEGRGIGLLNKIRAYNLQDQGADTVEANERLGFAADLRDYSMCRDMLSHLGISSLRLMTNNPRKVDALKSYGIDIAERVPLHVGRNPHNEGYLNTKQSKLGHWLETHQDDDPVE
ncbi:MAG: GTP cyclohydrolase II [Marinobacter sp.]|uniref:GTP cyclohydrolase II n=1 Tax=Marinobacter sp. TaxID=50741 RepID=UPI00299E20E1|nr:GTP cyclohydrolase II [Marinobacter sp.]MDX1755779.1 GTP cyclohydrolase II [Marinobacter sp.]